MMNYTAYSNSIVQISFIPEQVYSECLAAFFSNQYLWVTYSLSIPQDDLHLDR